MPTHKVGNCYQWGKHGKVYSTKAQADKQGRAIYANGWKNKVNEEKNIIDMKRTIRLTESDLRKVIKESVNKILKEWTSPQFEMDIDGKYQVPSKYGMYNVIINGCKNGRPVIDIQQNRRDGSRSNTTIKPDTYYHTLFIERFNKYYQQTQDVQETLNMVIPSL